MSVKFVEAEIFDPDILDKFKRMAKFDKSYQSLYLGVCYAEGVRGKKQDLIKSGKYYLKAAEQGCYLAQNILGIICYNGKRGMPQSYEKAVEWWTKGAEQDECFSQFHLGECYLKGHGVEKNLDTAKYWFQLSAESEYPKAIQALKELGG